MHFNTPILCFKCTKGKLCVVFETTDCKKLQQLAKKIQPNRQRFRGKNQHAILQNKLVASAVPVESDQQKQTRKSNA